MSTNESIHVDSEEEYEERAQRLKQDAAETKQELEQKQEAALKEIESGETLESYETATLGDLEMEVKAWFPGSLFDDVQHAQQLAQSENPEKVFESIDTMIQVLDNMTVSDTYNEGFWREYFQKWGPEALGRAMQAILEPAQEEQEAKMDSLDGFRPDTTGPRPSVGDGSDG